MRYRPALLALVVLCACKDHGITETPTPPNPQSVSVLTQHNDNNRSGLNDKETALTTSNVTPQQFGLVFTLPVDDEVYAQPLVVGGLSIESGARNIVYVATVSNSLYAFDGDNGKLYWHKNFTAAGLRPPRNSDMTGACDGRYVNFDGNIGIVGTPVIDAGKQTIYFVSRSTDGARYVQDLHAVNILSGAEVAGSPVRITATVAGNGDGSVNNTITFNAQKQNQRQALTLVNGTVYVSFSSHCDWGPYHGWILGYDATTLQQRTVYNDTPNGYAGGIWESGMGLAADAEGNLYAVVGNGSVGVSGDPTSPVNRGESAMKLTVNGNTLRVASYFTPAEFQLYNDYDLDYGTMGSLLIPGSRYFLTGGKESRLYLLNKDDMGGWVVNENRVQQIVTLGPRANMHCQAAYYRDASTEWVYVWSENDPLRAIPFDRGAGVLVPSGERDVAGGPTGQSGAVLSVSSNGMQPGTGILWASYAYTGDAEDFVSPGILRAFDASDVTKELWNNRMNLQRDFAGAYAKFASPTIANGHVYLPTFSNTVAVYGLR